ncbi:hypothetical protein CC1G_10448 [Coprinopsis cinerea okayama7|uniref:Xylanolytic transcriptional activator regulatory domain-containing protein n=1 Tax=Coprinopsis cinerea (strain Okayama-7 / 130 / ATCC MYA-4618 / FGSC 9003) TaxID=240176 RepID=A8PDT4_COPC7|nr:hypothetical protein CC1G_10448 [Coprinopsis cinerea okayama7\|eukprot:XP_001840662.2 hypothetical protein CC1G_10448 [Coprinopsis cinerea okayama7\
MPVDTTRVISTRRTQKHISEEELKDIELKRLRGILSAGQGTRFILADTDQLHRKIAEMSNRIRQLEDALAILQATVSDERHPLLSDEHLKIKFGSEALDPKKPAEPANEDDAKHAIDALGTLTLGESGEMKYFGRSAGSETLMMAEDSEEDEGQEGEMPIPLSPEIEQMDNMVPLLSHREPTPQLLQHFDSFLPSREKATALCEVYLLHGTFFFRPVKRDELYDVLLPSVYQGALLRSQGQPAMEEDGAPHATATLFFIFSLGALLDVQLTPYNALAEHYYHLGRAALSLRPVCGSPSLETVQAVGLMATYHNLAGKKYSRDSAWCIMSLAAKLAQSFGLHRDSARWNLDAQTVQKRRNLFWEVFAADVSHSLALGRPPAIHLSYVDCEFPEDEEASTSPAGEKQSGFWALKHHYAKHIFYAVAEATLTAQAPSYETVLDLDRKVREMSYQSSAKPYASREVDGKEIYHSSSLSLRDFYVSQYRTAAVMIYLHRSFFAQAVLDHPSNPLLSTFAPSFLTAYRCASVIIKASVHHFDRCASMAKRVWFLLYHTFSAAVIAGTIVTRSPASTMARNAIKDLDIAVGLFEQAADQSHRARVALAVLKRLQDKAHRSYKTIEGGKEPPSPDIQDEDDDQLAIFGGQLRVVTKKSGRSKDNSGTGGGDSPLADARERSRSASRDRDTTLSLPVNTPSPEAVRGSPASMDATPSTTTLSDSPLATTTFAGYPLPLSSSDRFLEQFSRFAPPPPAPSKPLSTPGATHLGHPSTSPPVQQWAGGWDWNMSHAPAPQRSRPVDWLTNAPPLTRITHNSFPSSSQGFMHRHPQSFERNTPFSTFGGSDASTGSQYPQASQYDLQENAGVLSSMFSSNVPTGNRSTSSTELPELAQFKSPFGDIFHGQPQAGPSRPAAGPPGSHPGNPGAVELGLSGESRLDSGWIAFMRDCGIFGMDTSQ